MNLLGSTICWHTFNATVKKLSTLRANMRTETDLTHASSALETQGKDTTVDTINGRTKTIISKNSMSLRAAWQHHYSLVQKILEVGLEPTISSLGGRRLIH